MSYKPIEKELAKAKRARERRLASITAKLQACNCMFPIRVLRNGSGHSDDCPAHALYMKEREEREERNDW